MSSGKCDPNSVQVILANTCQAAPATPQQIVCANALEALFIDTNALIYLAQQRGYRDADEYLRALIEADFKMHNEVVEHKVSIGNFPYSR